MCVEEEKGIDFFYKAPSTINKSVPIIGRESNCSYRIQGLLMPEQQCWVNIGSHRG